MSSSILSGVPRKVWRFLCSVRLALVVILVLSAAALAGALIVQAPGEVLSSQAGYQRWVEGLRPRFGSFTGFLDFLGLFKVFHVWWFNALGALLVLNLIACTVNRFPARWRAVRQARVKVGRDFFEHGRHRALIEAPAQDLEKAAGLMSRVLRRRRYVVTVEKGESATYVYGERNRWGQLGTFLTHGGIVLMLGAALWSNVAGFRDTTLVIPDGSVREVGHGTTLSVLNEGFIEEDYPDGRPRDYRSDLVLYEDGREVKRGTVRVNEPMQYGGVRFHQSFFGNAAVVRVRDSAGGQLLYEDGVALAYRSEIYGISRPLGFFTLPELGLIVDVVGMAQDARDTLINPWEVFVAIYDSNSTKLVGGGKLALGEPYRTAGMEFTFLREKQYTGLSVVKTPGIDLLWFASALLVLGICAVLYFPHRRVWVYCPASGQVALAGAAPRMWAFDEEFRLLASELEREMAGAAVHETSAPAAAFAGERET
ncbi:MAG: cytochrome c biogenesis protein ResB [Chloroflexi bacterium]|nr:cytochrome c biogenesis protein ResB [Chloroflexota bacterium]